MQRRYQVTYMPWLGIDHSIKAGPLSITPLREFLGRSDLPSGVEPFLRRYFACYVDSIGHPVETICVCHGDLPLLNVDDISLHPRVCELASFLALACIGTALLTAVASRNRTLGPPSGDKFQVVTKLFGPEDHGVAIFAGNMSSYVDLDELRVQVPWHVTSRAMSIPLENLSAIAEFVGRQPEAHLARRLVQAAAWFRLAHAGGDEVDWLPRIVMLATAFEALLDAGQQSQKSNPTRSKLDELFTRPAGGQIKYPKIRRSLKNRDYEHTHMAWFFHDLFALRNSIVHAEVVEATELKAGVSYLPWLTKFELASMLLWECFLENLLGHGAFDARIKREFRRLCDADGDKVVDVKMWEACAQVFVVGDVRAYDRTNLSIGWAAKTGESLDK